MPFQKWRRFIGLLILLVSLAILIWGLWPTLDQTRSVPIQPGELQLPAPESLLWMVIHVI
jgi:hypothetical protein